MANILLEFGKDIELAAEDVLHDVAKANVTVAKYAPGAIAALGVLATGVEKALADVSTDAANPLGAVITVPQQLADFKVLWPQAKEVLASLGITKI